MEEKYIVKKGMIQKIWTHAKDALTKWIMIGIEGTSAIYWVCRVIHVILIDPQTTTKVISASISIFLIVAILAKASHVIWSSEPIFANQLQISRYTIHSFWIFLIVPMIIGFTLAPYVGLQDSEKFFDPKTINIIGYFSFSLFFILSIVIWSLFTALLLVQLLEVEQVEEILDEESLEINKNTESAQLVFKGMWRRQAIN